MPNKTYRLTINKSDNTSDVVTFTIPATAGTYNLSFTNSSGQTINAGNIVVGNSVKTYSLTLGLSNGTTINCGTIQTPIPAAEKSLKSFVNNELTEITAADLGNITAVSDYAFYGLNNLSNVVLPEGVTTIGKYAFFELNNLSNVILPESVTTIGDYAFSSVNFDFDLIQFGSNVTTIGEEIFNCSSSTISSPTGHISVLRVLATTPPSVKTSFNSTSGIYGVSSGDLTIDRIEVPSASLSAYQEANVWKNYNLVGI